MELITSAAAERNKQPICEQLQALLPANARVLEIASGNGQHVVHFATQIPDSSWQPTDFTSAELPIIAARTVAAALSNIAPPRQLDVLDAEWSLPQDYEAIVCINMIHISPWATTPALFAGAMRHLGDDGIVVLYGPYLEGGEHTAPSNAAFDAWLKARDPRFGVRNLEDVDAAAAACGFTRFHLARMPANNLLLGFRRRIAACNPS